MKKILSFFELFAFVLALVGGIGYTLHSGAYIIAAAIVVLGFMALPEVKKAWERLNK